MSYTHLTKRERFVISHLKIAGFIEKKGADILYLNNQRTRIAKQVHKEGRRGVALFKTN